MARVTKQPDMIAFKVFTCRAGFSLPSGPNRQAEACPTEITNKAGPGA